MDKCKVFLPHSIPAMWGPTEETQTQGRKQTMFHGRICAGDHLRGCTRTVSEVEGRDLGVPEEGTAGTVRMMNRVLAGHRSQLATEIARVLPPGLWCSLCSRDGQRSLLCSLPPPTPWGGFLVGYLQGTAHLEQGEKRPRPSPQEHQLLRRRQGSQEHGEVEARGKSRESEAEKPTDNPQGCQKAPQGIGHLLSQQWPGLYGVGPPTPQGVWNTPRPAHDAGPASALSLLSPRVSAFVLLDSKDPAQEALCLGSIRVSLAFMSPLSPAHQPEGFLSGNKTASPLPT